MTRDPRDPAEGSKEDGAKGGRPRTMPPLCDEYSGGGGSFPDTRDRALPEGPAGDCDHVGNAPKEPRSP